MKYRNILRAAFGTVWAIQLEKLQAIEEFLALQAAGNKFSLEEINARAGDDRGRRLKQVKGNVAIIPIYGVISQRAGLMTDVSGMTSVEQASAAFDDAMAANDVKAILLDIDSPGGAIGGVPEFARKVYEARGQGKQIVSVANSLAASAAYWIGAAADQFAVTPSGDAGSIGVYAMHVDQSELDAATGVKPTYISAGKFKTEGNPHGPLTDDARAALQASVDEAYDMFTADVARFRSTTQYQVKNGYGEGRVLSASRSVEEGLADRVASFEKVLGELTGDTASARRLKRAEEQQPYKLTFHGGLPIWEVNYDRVGWMCTTSHAMDPEPTWRQEMEAAQVSDLEDRRRRWRNAKRKMDL